MGMRYFFWQKSQSLTKKKKERYFVVLFDYLGVFRLNGMCYFRVEIGEIDC